MEQDPTAIDPQRPMCSEPGKETMVAHGHCYPENRATLHLHGGITPWISDGTPHQWITPRRGHPVPGGRQRRGRPRHAGAGTDAPTDSSTDGDVVGDIADDITVVAPVTAPRDRRGSRGQRPRATPPRSPAHPRRHRTPQT
ncbi:hypothetical protein [Georgenia sp. SUBG003]|uniref:hypothetical protein n=1 Tax=Georgenia sp. SUBG003 TaxID=1497974 RepID=UPI003AB5B017